MTAFPIRIYWLQIRIHHFRLNTDPDPIRIRSNPIGIEGFYDQELTKKTQLKKLKLFLDQKLQFSYP